MQHHDTHEDRLLDLVASTEDPSAAFQASELSACATCGELLEGYAHLSRALERSGRQERKSAQLAEGVRDAPGEELVERVLRPRLENPPEPASPGERPPKVPWLSVLGAVVAAALLVQFFLYDPFSTPKESYGAQTSGGDQELEITYPIGEVATWTGFSWEGELPPGSSFYVRVADLDGGLLSETKALQATTWIPEADQTATWPDHIRWDARIMDASGIQLSRAWGRAWLASD